MTKIIRIVLLGLAIAAVAQPAAAQAQGGGWNVSVYPVMAWVPLGIDINVEVPPVDGGGGGGTGEIIDGRFDGAFFGGFSADNGKFRIDADGLWAAFGGDRPERPALTVDVDAIYGHGTVGFAVKPGLYVIGGVRRFALKYVIDLNNTHFERKPGIWDPLVGLAWHAPAGDKLDLHATFEAGGFGAGSDLEIATGLRIDWKPITHFGLTAGYNFLYLKATDTLVTREFTFTQTLHGPLVGIGFYF